MTCAAMVRVDVLLLEGQQRLHAASHASIFADARVVDLHALDFGAQFAILAADAAQVGVGGPEILHPLLAVNHGFFDRRDGGDGPQTNETGFAFLRRAAHLHRQGDNLGEQDGRQHDQVLIAAKECVHKLRCISSALLCEPAKIVITSAARDLLSSH